MKETEGDRKLFTPKMINVSQVIHVGPCIVSNVTISGDGAAADCDVYDGVNNLAERKYHLEALSGTTASLGDSEDKQFNHGLYIVVNAVTTFVTILFRPLDKKKEEKKEE